MIKRDKEKCKHRIVKEVKIEGVFFDGCRKSRKNLQNDICDCNTKFCEEHYREVGCKNDSKQTNTPTRS